MSTIQTLLNTSVAHVLKQGKPSAKLTPSPYVGEEDKVTCLYRGEDGLQCAAGPFIVHYSPDMENKIFSVLAESLRFRDGLQEDARVHAEFVNTLQTAHDEAARRALRDGADFISAYKEQLARYVPSKVSLEEAYAHAEAVNG
jgi:hypothetical protein